MTRILITGANGFIGGRLLKRLAVLYGAENIVTLSSKEIPGYRCVLYKGRVLASPIEIDFSDIDIVVHAGAYIPKRSADANLIDKCNENVSFTEMLLSLRLPKLKKIIYLSTSDVYESSELINEDSMVNPQSMYGWSKFYCEKMLSYFAKEREVELITLRVGHVYGPGEEQYQKILPLTISNILSNKPLTLWGDGEEKRSFIYIDDVVQSIEKCISKCIKEPIINVVGGNVISIKDLVDKLITLSGKSLTVNCIPSDHIRKNLIFDNSLLKNTLLPVEFDFDQGLQNEFDYMRQLSEHHN